MPALQHGGGTCFFSSPSISIGHPSTKASAKKKKKQKEEGHNEHFVVHDAATGTAVEQVPGGAMW